MRQHPSVRPSSLALLGLVAATGTAPLAAQRGSLVPAAVAAAPAAVPRAVEYRHDIHANPELANREVRTARLVADRLTALGFEVRTGIAGTGVVGTLRGGRPGPLLAIRADMDALPVLEETDLPFRSTVTAEYEGRTVPVSHACGHDIHVAVQLGVAEVLAGMRARLPGTVQFIFQPAEEGAPRGETGGAERMLAEGLWAAEKPAAIFGLHVLAQLPLGTIGYTPGPAFAGSARWTAALIGRSAHGAKPHLAIDPVVMSAEAVLALQTIRSRHLDPLVPSVVTVGRITGGTRNNIIPERVELDGTIRYFSPGVRDSITSRLRTILDGVAHMHGGRAEFALPSGVQPPVVNDSTLVAFAGPVLRRTFGDAQVQVIEPTLGGEDFAFFADAVPGFFFRIGGLRPGTTTGDHHTGTFRADDGAVDTGIRAMTSLVVAFLEQRAGK